MKVVPITEFKNGWYVGNFDPSIYKTSDFEIGILHHKMGEKWDCHYHTGTEINYLISGRMKIQNQELISGDVFMLNPYEVSDPVFLSDCVVVVLKTPSKPGDKYIAEWPNDNT